MGSFQSRLQAKQNKISQKLIDQSINLTGVMTDVIRIKSVLSKYGDPETRMLESIDVVSIIFPPMKDIPMKRFRNEAVIMSANDATKFQPFETYAPVDKKIDQDDILLRFFDNPQGDEPWILPLQVMDVLGTFGARSIVWQKLNLGYYNEKLPQKVYEFCEDLAERREILKY